MTREPNMRLVEVINSKGKRVRVLVDEHTADSAWWEQITRAMREEAIRDGLFVEVAP